MYAFLVPPRNRTFLMTTIHVLSRGGKGKLFNADLINKLIRMEGVSERHRLISDRLLSSWMLLIHEQKGKGQKLISKHIFGPNGMLCF